MFVNDLGIFDKVMFSPAVRYEHYSDFGHTVNGKLATKLDLSRAFAVRGSMSSGFRAPSMHQLYFNSVSNQFNSDGYFCAERYLQERQRHRKGHRHP